MDMWVGTRSAWHSKSLERRCQTAVRMFRGAITCIIQVLYKVCIIRKDKATCL